MGTYSFNREDFRMWLRDMVAGVGLMLFVASAFVLTGAAQAYLTS
jgi:hypothetical protein